MFTQFSQKGNEVEDENEYKLFANQITSYNIREHFSLSNFTIHIDNLIFIQFAVLYLPT